MTGSALRLERRNHGRNHSYRIDGEKVPGVTTVLNTLSKPGLVNWAAGCAAEKAVNEWDWLATLPLTERLNVLKWAHRDNLKASAARGTTIHEYGERIVNGERVEVAEELRGPVEAYAVWLDEWQIEPIATETPLAHVEHGYAGTADLWAHVGAGPFAGADMLIDLKTGKGVYDETALQLAAYRHAEFVQITDGTLRTEEPTPKVEGALVAHIGHDSVRTRPADTGEDVFRTFLYLLAVHRATLDWSEWPLIGADVQLEASA